KQMVIDDDDVAFGCAPPHFGDEAAVVFLAFLAEAGIGPGVELVPESAGFGKFREFGAITGLRRFLPRGDGAVVLDLLQSAEHGLIGEVEKLLAAKIVAASLHVADAQLAILSGKQRTLQRG